MQDSLLHTLVVTRKQREPWTDNRNSAIEIFLLTYKPSTSMLQAGFGSANPVFYLSVDHSWDALLHIYINIIIIRNNSLLTFSLVVFSEMFLTLLGILMVKHGCEE
jgi:hypothetical protein